MQFDHLADDDDGGWLDLLFFHRYCQVFQIGNHDTLVLCGSLLHQSNRCRLRQAVLDQLLGQHAYTVQPHIEHDGLVVVCQRLPVKINGTILQVAGNKHDRLCIVAMGQRDT